MPFYSGQKVICVNAADNGNGSTGLVKNAEYTVLRELDGGVLIVEVEPSPCWAFDGLRFRPALTKKTDISIFRTRVLEDA